MVSARLARSSPLRTVALCALVSLLVVGWMGSGGLRSAAALGEFGCTTNALSSTCDCLAGSVVVNASATPYTCLACGVGKYSGITDATTCTDCAVNTITTATNSSSCANCPYRSTTLGATGSNLCTCDADFVRILVNSTVECINVQPQVNCSHTTNTTTNVTGGCDCPLGTIIGDDAIAPYVCNICAAGKAGATLNATACTTCAVNTIASAQESSSCAACPRRSTTLGLTGATNCTCDTGFNPTVVSGTITQCTSPQATVWCTIDTSTATCYCPLGTFIDDTSAWPYRCTYCAAGKTTLAINALTCSDCLINTYAGSDGSSSCSLCPWRSTTLSKTGASACTCDAGYLRTSNGSCTTCPSGAECSSSPGVAKALPGFWYDSTETQAYYECPDNYCCDKKNGIGCLTTDSLRCYAHRHGFLCASCDSGYTALSTGECVSCSGMNAMAIVIIVVLGFIFLAVCLLENPNEDASTKLIVDYVQMVAYTLNPTIVAQGVLQLIHLDLTGTIAKFNACVLPLSPLIDISSTAFLPVGLFVGLGMIHGVHWLLSKFCRRETWQAFYETHKWRYTSAAWEITLFGFMAVVAACAKLMDCSHIANYYVVTLAPSVACFSGGHMILAVVAFGVFCILTFVVPIWLVSMLNDLSKTTERRSTVFLHSMRQIKKLKKEYQKQKKQIDSLKPKKAASDDDEEADAAGAGGGASAANVDQKIMDIDEYLRCQMQQTKKVTRTGHEIALWCYHADNYWCEAAFILRRILFTLVTVLLPREKAAMVVIWFCVLILVWHSRYPVFRKKSSGFFHDFCLAAIAFQSVLNLDIFSQDKKGRILFGTSSAQAQVVVVYAITCLPVAIGLAMFIKEFFKERVRKRHAESDGTEAEPLAPVVDEVSESEEEEEEEEEAEDAAINFEKSSSIGGSRFGLRAGRSPSVQSVAGALTHGVLMKGPNVSTRSYNNAPIDLDAVLASQTGGIVSTPAFPNHHHPPVTIHF